MHHATGSLLVIDTVLAQQLYMIEHEEDQGNKGVTWGSYGDGRPQRQKVHRGHLEPCNTVEPTHKYHTAYQ